MQYLKKDNKTKEKVCTKCNKEKNLTEYCKNGRNGLRADCRECAKARTKKWREENPEYNKKYSKKYREENPEKAKAHVKKWHQENPDKLKANMKKWQQENPEKRRLIYAKRRAQKLNTQVEEITVKLLNEHWVKKGIDPERCYYCDEAPYEHLEHCTPLSRGGTHTKENLVPSCAHCNLSKGSKTPDEWDKHRGL